MRLAVVVALAGCDLVWGVPAPHGTLDAPLGDAPPDGETCFTYDQSIDADVLLISTAGTPRDQGHGSEAIMNVGVPVQSQGLLRYSAPTLTAGQRIAAVRFVAPFAPSSHACGTATSCGSCVPIGQDGRFDVEYAMSAWTESAACFNRPTSMTTWQTVGATGATDRSPSVGQVTYAKATDLTIDLDPAPAAAWIQNGKLSVILTPSLGAVTILPQRDYAVADGACAPNQPGTKLSFTVCQ